MIPSDTTVVYGHGFIGRKLLNSLSHAVPGRADITSEVQVLDEIDRLQPKVVINCAGKTGTPNIDWCEHHRQETWLSNVIGPQVLGQVCRLRGVYLVHLSSGCVFHSEVGQRCWRESDSAQAYNFYTQSKLAAERLLLPLDTAIVRLRIPLDTSYHPRNLLTKLSTFRFITSSLNSVTLLDDLVSAVETIILHRATGILHCVSPEPTRLSSLVRTLCEHRGIERCYREVRSRDLQTMQLVTARRSDAVLSIERLLKLGHVPPARDWIERAIERYVTNQFLSSPMVSPNYAQ